MHKRAHCLVVIGLLTGSSVIAQDTCGVLNPDKCGLPAAAAKAVGSILDAQLSSSPTARVAAAALTKLLGDLTVSFKTFDTENAVRSGVGFEYDWSKRLSSWVLPDNDANVNGFSWSLNANGNVAFDEETNPKDFLKSGTTLGWVFSKGGVIAQLPRETSLRLQDAITILADVPTDSLATHPLNQAVMREISQTLSTQVFVSLDAQVAYEANQSFTAEQVTYGGRLGLDIKAWNPNTLLAKLNVLDWPFALLRYLTATEPQIKPRGSALPTFLLSLDLVDPADDPLRDRLATLDPFPRLAIEAGFRTLAGKVTGGNIFAEANLRYYQEIGADRAVLRAGIDDFFLFVAALTGPGGSFVSYSIGDLPFDRTSDKVYELGFRYKF